MVGVDELVSPTQMFRCEPYAATIRASVCLGRQAEHGERVQIGARGQVERRARTKRQAHKKLDRGKCALCSLGERVRAQLGAP